MAPYLRNTIYSVLVASQVIFCIVSYLPQIIRLIRTKKSDDISIHTWVLLTLSFADYGLILLMDHASPALHLLNAFELFLCFSTTALTIWYRSHGRTAGPDLKEEGK